MKPFTQAQGFSLVEMAIVLMIMGALMGGTLVAVSTTLENSRRTAARTQLHEIEEALYGFAQSTGRLPCPAAGGATGGQEVQLGTTSCSIWHGFVPAVTLGLTGGVNANGLLVDPWQNPYRYSLASQSNYFANNTDMKTLYNNVGTLLVPGANMLRLCNSSDCSGVVLGDTIPAVVLSMGSNWAAFTSNNEIENGSGTVLNGLPVTNTNDFVVTEYSENFYDDQLVWISPYVLFNKLVSSGQLP